MQSFVCLSCLRAPTSPKLKPPFTIVQPVFKDTLYIHNVCHTKFLFLRCGAKCADRSPGVHYKHVVFHYV